MSKLKRVIEFEVSADPQYFKKRQVLASLFRMLWNRMVPQPEPGARSKLVARVTVFEEEV